MGCFSGIITLLLTVAIGIGLGLYFGVFTKKDLGDLAGAFKDGFNDIIGSDPFSGLGSGKEVNSTVYRWVGSTGKGGLTLELLNALDDSWQTYFEQAVYDWESGSPDALSLSTSNVTAESECEQVDGVMKVCNGNYGDTGWRGINEILLNGNDRIVSSAAKMNEYYLTSTTSSNDKQYTMCHEIGHGFGLPHTDENFLNSALGDCLDYSSNVAKNLKPGQVNYDKLVKAYGVVGSLRGLRLNPLSQISQESLNEIETPHHIRNLFRQKIKSFRVGIENEGWITLRKHSLGERHTIELGKGYRGQIDLLLEPN
jgi:hypothetical protein